MGDRISEVPLYSAENNRRNTGRQTRKRETKMNMGRRYKRLDWLEMIQTDREQQKGETYMGHLQPTAMDATLNELIYCAAIPK